jgi:hypothetical protein
MLEVHLELAVEYMVIKMRSRSVFSGSGGQFGMKSQVKMTTFLAHYLTGVAAVLIWSLCAVWFTSCCVSCVHGLNVWCSWCSA